MIHVNYFCMTFITHLLINEWVNNSKGCLCVKQSAKHCEYRPEYKNWFITVIIKYNLLRKFFPYFSLISSLIFPVIYHHQWDFCQEGNWNIKGNIFYLWRIMFPLNYEKIYIFSMLSFCGGLWAYHLDFSSYEALEVFSILHLSPFNQLSQVPATISLVATADDSGRRCWREHHEEEQCPQAFHGPYSNSIALGRLLGQQLNRSGWGSGDYWMRLVFCLSK